MKALRLISCIFLFFFAQIVFALPPGSYLDSCQNCTQVFNSLTCSCRNNQQFPVMSTLWNFNRCDYITNEDGQLTCHHSRGNPLPPGSYQQSCHYCHTDYSGNLICMCPTYYGSMQRTTLYNAYQCSENGNDILNQNGRLICTSANHYNPNYLPPGRYLNMCSNCYVNGNDLTCNCAGQYGVPPQTTTLQNGAFCHNVQVVNGQLICPFGAMHPGVRPPMGAQKSFGSHK
jgi:hypothetical protein